MKKRAVLVGINDYSDRPLAGPLNDVALMRRFLKDRCGFNVNTEIVRALDATGTKGAILERLEWLVHGAEPGDRLLFHFSGHGDQLTSAGDAGEADQLDEVLCTLGFNSTNATAIRDNELAALFSRLRPSGAHVVWACDSCHAGGMPRAARGAGEAAGGEKTVRSWSVSPEREPRSARALAPGRAAGRMRQAMSALPVVFIGACAEGQQAYEGPLGGQVYGALTYHLVQELERPGGLTASIAQIVENTSRAMRQAGYAQDAVLVAPGERAAAPLFWP
ncbi:caspase family protein [Sorangium sp. So ce363]|uniref:caspase family protein n=1 Tax=Sorangium sp. So ce363 TaxID=3133304 RepID=UPI003F5FCFDC